MCQAPSGPPYFTTACPTVNASAAATPKPFHVVAMACDADDQRDEDQRDDDRSDHAEKNGRDRADRNSEHRKHNAKRHTDRHGDHDPLREGPATEEGPHRAAEG